jgi:hypothetical protein
MQRHKDSHLDHGLNEAQIAYIFAWFHERNEFFMETIVLPEWLGEVPCALVGPLMGDPPVTESEVTYEKRGLREYVSRLIDTMPRTTNKVTVIGGPHDGLPCILYTAFGGPATRQEPGDPECKDVAASREFWSKHALCKWAL